MRVASTEYDSDAKKKEDASVSSKSHVGLSGFVCVKPDTMVKKELDNWLPKLTSPCVLTMASDTNVTD